ncbi:hypothetical protein [Alienimonas chondri]|uniref:Uncharacterized protein n=1 Tax=Alienimonas chondri TaxID=2681879 RepID=A0ABX1VD64_9PLAN|nr:hypothetical protein [Alienimonas chondri]NNJ25728.1 hypothetical protein [Alienimonas chondri]
MRRCLSLAPLLALTLAGSSFVRPAVAQEEEPVQELLEPVGVVTLAGVDRARSDVDALFDTIGRGDMADVIDGLLETVNNLGGVERTKPLGVMVFLKPGFVPIPSPVGFLPVSDVGELRDSLALRDGMSTEELAPDLLEIKGRQFSLFAKLANGYALISNEREFVEERLLPDPTLIAGPLAARYDFAVQVLPGNIPPGMRKLFQNLLNQNTETQMQRRDEEPEAAFRLRKTQAKRNLEVIQAMLAGSDAITLGLDASPERETVELDLAFDAVAGTAWADSLALVKGRGTPFDVLHEETAPLSLVAGTTFNQWDQESTIEQLKLGRDEIAAALSGLRPLGDEDPAREAELESAREEGRSDYALIDPAALRLANDVFEPLIVTVENGELDFFVQVRPSDSGGKTVMGAVAIAQGDRFSQGVPKVLEQIAEKLPEDNDLVKAMTLNVAQENGVTWHRFDPEPRPESYEIRDPDSGEVVETVEQGQQGAEFFGGKPALHVGLGRQNVWVVLGAENSLAEAMATVEAVRANGNRLGAPPEAPVRGAINVSGWFPDSIDAGGEEMLRAREAFSDGSDRLTIRFEPTPTGGARLRLVFGEGFVRFLALSITDRYDQSQL